MPRQEIDCSNYSRRCDELRRVVLEGLSADKLRRMGIEPGSDRALRLEHGAWDIFLRCCARLSGRAPDRQGPDLPTPPPAPSSPWQPPPTPTPAPPTGPVVAGFPPLLVGGVAGGLALDGGLAWGGGSAIDWAALRARLAGLRVPHPLIVLIIVAAALAAASGTQVCVLVRTRINMRGERECLYLCPSGAMYYEYDFFGAGCLPTITKPI